MRARAPYIRAWAKRAAPSDICAWRRPACRSPWSWVRIARLARRRGGARDARPRSGWCDRRATQHRVHAGRIVVLADRDDDLSAIGLQGRGAVQGAPDLAARRFFRELHEDDGAKIGQPLVHYHATHALDREAIAQVAQKQRLVGHLLDDAGFARRDLADDGGEDRRALVGDGG